MFLTSFKRFYCSEDEASDSVDFVINLLNFLGVLEMNFNIFLFITITTIITIVNSIPFSGKFYSFLDQKNKKKSRMSHLLLLDLLFIIFKNYPLETKNIYQFFKMISADIWWVHEIINNCGGANRDFKKDITYQINKFQITHLSIVNLWLIYIIYKIKFWDWCDKQCLIYPNWLNPWIFAVYWSNFYHSL